jgi:hypothetical protein
MSHSPTNPAARDADDVLGTSLPDTVSAATWNRPYTYFVVRTDEDRPSHLDNHEDGRIVLQFHTRNNAVGWKALLKRDHPDNSYVIRTEPNESYDTTN